MTALVALGWTGVGALVTFVLTHSPAPGSQLGFGLFLLFFLVANLLFRMRVDRLQTNGYPIARVGLASVCRVGLMALPWLMHQASLVLEDYRKARRAPGAADLLGLMAHKLKAWTLTPVTWIKLPLPPSLPDLSRRTPFEAWFGPLEPPKVESGRRLAGLLAKPVQNLEHDQDLRGVWLSPPTSLVRLTSVGGFLLGFWLWRGPTPFWGGPLLIGLAGLVAAWALRLRPGQRPVRTLSELVWATDWTPVILSGRGEGSKLTGNDGAWVEVDQQLPTEEVELAGYYDPFQQRVLCRFVDGRRCGWPGWLPLLVSGSLMVATGYWGILTWLRL